MSKLRYPKEILDVLRREAEAAYPREACGLLSGMPGRWGPVPIGVHAMENVYDRYHEADPEAYPRTSRTAYLMDPGKQAALVRALEAAGTPVCCIYHSHVDTGAYFSEEDERAALWDGQPLFPGVEYLVLGVQEGKVQEAKAFWWTGERFEGREVSLDRPRRRRRGGRASHAKGRGR
jgi:proteasome lid subunit RPN8/RPN11